MPKLSMGTGSRVLMCHGGPPLCRGPHDSANDSLELKLRPVPTNNPSSIEVQLLSLRCSHPTGATLLLLAPACTTCCLCHLVVFPPHDVLRHRGWGAKQR